MSPFKIAAIAGWSAAAVLFLSGAYMLKRIVDLNEDLGLASAQVDHLVSVSEKNSKEIAECLDVNAANMIRRNEAETRAAEAAMRVREMTSLVAVMMEQIEIEEQLIREVGDETCRTLDDPLPDYFLDWVWDDQDGS